MIDEAEHPYHSYFGSGGCWSTCSKQVVELLITMRAPYNFEIKVFYRHVLCKHFPHSMRCLFMSLMLSFDEKKFLILSKPNVSTASLMVQTFSISSWRFLSVPKSRYFKYNISSNLTLHSGHPWGPLSSAEISQWSLCEEEPSPAWPSNTSQTTPTPDLSLNFSPSVLSPLLTPNLKG